MSIEIVRSLISQPAEKRQNVNTEEAAVEQAVDYLTGTSNIPPDIAPFAYPHNPGFDPPKKTDVFRNDTHFNHYQANPPEKIIPIPTQQNLHTTPASPLKRRMLQGAAVFAGYWITQNIEQLAQGTTEATRTAEFLYYLQTDRVVHDFIYPPEIAPLLAPQQPTEYTPIAFQKTHTITFGDSLARGEVEGGYEAPPAWEIVQSMNEYPEDTHDWSWQNEAWNGATTQEVKEQIAILEKKIKENKMNRPASIDTDVILSVGGNDTLTLVRKPEIFAVVTELMEDPYNPKLIRQLAHDVDAFLNNYAQNLREILDDIQNLKFEHSLNMQRLILHGLPDIANAEYITLPNNQRLPMTGATQAMATRISKLLNYTIVEEFRNFQPHAGFDVIFIDNGNLEKEDFLGMHPNEQGYKKIAHNQMKQTVVRLPKRQPTSLYEITRAA